MFATANINSSGAKVMTTSTATPLKLSPLTVDRRSATGETALAERLLAGFFRVLHRELNADWYARATWFVRFREGCSHCITLLHETKALVWKP